MPSRTRPPSRVLVTLVVGAGLALAACTSPGSTPSPSAMMEHSPSPEASGMMEESPSPSAMMEHSPSPEASGMMEESPSPSP